MIRTASGCPAAILILTAGGFVQEPPWPQRWRLRPGVAHLSRVAEGDG
jgi:hypothetical protein